MQSFVVFFVLVAEWNWWLQVDTSDDLRKNGCKISLFTHHISFDGCVAMIQSFFFFLRKGRNGQICVKRHGFNYNIFDLPFTSSAAQRCSTSEECYTKSRQPPSGAASCCWYAQDTQDQPRYASLLFKGRPDKDTGSQRRNAWTANVGTTVSSLVMILFSGDEGFFLDKKQDWVEEHGGIRLGSQSGCLHIH